MLTSNGHVCLVYYSHSWGQLFVVLNQNNSIFALSMHVVGVNTLNQVILGRML